MKTPRENNLTVAFIEDGSIKVGWDLTTDQLTTLRDNIIPVLLNRNALRAKPAEFTLYTWPPKE